MARAKVKAPCQPATLGGGFFGLPKKVIESPAYRDLSVHARAVLIEIGARADGYNNGKIGIDQRAMREAIRCSPRKIIEALAELMEHGLIDVTVEGKWTEKMAREYRITFISTPRKPATNDYLQWRPKEKLSVTDAVTRKADPVTDAVTRGEKPATDAVTAKIAKARKSVADRKKAVTDAVAHITKPYPPAQTKGAEGDHGPSENTYSAAGHRFDSETDNQAIAVRQALIATRRQAGVGRLQEIARAAGADPNRVAAFLDHRDVLTAPTIARLNREIARAAA